jgi:hypothetical protein
VAAGSAVGFYLSRGFRLTEPLPEHFAREPEDIHMLLPLSWEDSEGKLAGRKDA